MPLQSTSGAASYDAFGGGAAAKVNYIEDFFQSYLRTGTGASATVTTGLDGSTKETLVWTKSRSAATNHKLTDNVRGATKALSSNTTDAEATDSQGLTAFSATGYTLGTNTDYNNSGATYVDWQWIAQPKFFDVVTFTKSSSPQTISHNLGSTPGCIFIKRTDSTGGWLVAHRGYTGGITAGYTLLNTTDAFTSNANAVTAADSTTFTLGSAVVSGDFVAYLFAHNAGGFGLTGTDNVISCGSYTETSAPTLSVNLGYEPQVLLIKPSNGTGNWNFIDNMRGFSQTQNTMLFPNTSGAEGTYSAYWKPTATGFNADNVFGEGTVYIYIAIRRGPMKVPTTGTSVFNTKLRTGTDVATTISGIGFPTDLVFSKTRTPGGNNPSGVDFDRLRGIKQLLNIEATSAEYTKDPPMSDFTQDGYSFIAGANDPNLSGYTYCDWNFRRAPSFFDEVCYTGTGSNTTFTHNLGVAPELMIFKRRDTTANWRVYSSSQPASDLGTLNSNIYFQTDSNVLNSTAPTSSVFTVGTNAQTNASGGTYVAYLFATTAGVSKVGSYTGTGTTLQINCGFTGGSRFVLIKRVDDSADWYVWDSARGIVAGNDSYLLLNSTAAEVTNTDYIDTYSAGFEISSTAPAAINASGGSFIFFAVA